MNILEELKNRNLENNSENIAKLYLEEYNLNLKSQIESIKEELANGKSKYEILDSCEYSFQALNATDVGISVVDIGEDSKDVCDHWGYSIPNEGKFEYFENTCFGDSLGRDSLVRCLVANMGIKHFARLLTDNERKLLVSVLCEDTGEK